MMPKLIRPWPHKLPKIAKLRAEIENLSGRTVLAVRQDMHATVLAMN